MLKQMFGLFEHFENMFFVFLVQIRGWDGLYRIEETELGCAVSGIFCLVEDTLHLKTHWVKIHPMLLSSKVKIRRIFTNEMVKA